jgi:putative membrane-bound dehydrogenase-like protein
MKRLAVFAALLASVAVTSASEAGYKVPRGNFNFPIYTNRPAGKQITSGQLPATTHALSPEETRKLIEVPPGFEVRLFASEPMVVNPVAMTWDERGRLWVLELYEYPKGAPKGAKGRDRIKIIEDTDADGVADTVKIFADGYSLAEGLQLGNGGVYVAAPPNLYFLRDTNNDDKADTQEIILTGLGNEDRHELLNNLTWGPDGWLYMTHGVFTHSQVKDPNNPDDDGVRMDAALARWHPVTKKFEVFADGTSNPWGVDWNERGDAFVSACVIQHLFHMAPGGLYNRQGGTWPNPYGYVQDLPTKGLPAIVDWRHYRAAHSGICVYQGDQWPAEWRGLVFLGNIHQSALNCDRLTPVGATYKAEKESTLLKPAAEAVHKNAGHTIAKGEEWKHLGPGNFFVSRDPWVRPVSTQTGPDGAMWVMDWYDKYPCYQNAQADPEGVDREYGRIWRVVWVGDQPGKKVPSRPTKEMDLRKLPATELVNQLESKNSWQRRQAQRLLIERKGPAEELTSTISRLGMDKSKALETRIAAFGIFVGRRERLGPGDYVDRFFSGMPPELRAIVARWAGDNSFDVPPISDEFRQLKEATLKQDFATLEYLSYDPEVIVRAAAAAGARRFTSGSFTTDTKPEVDRAKFDLTAVFSNLLSRPSVEGDFYYPHIVWMAMEPRVAVDPQPFFALLAANENSVSTYATRRVMRRICDLSDVAAREKHLNAALEWLGTIASKTQLASAALDGLIEAQKSKSAAPTVNLEPILAKLTTNPALAERAQRLAAGYGDKSASRLMIAKINDPKASSEERLRGINAAKEAKSPAARDELMTLIKSPNASARLKTDAVRALTSFGSYDDAYAIVESWKTLPQMTRIAAAESLVRGTKTARALLAGVEKKIVSPSDISATARRELASSSDSTIADNADRLLGKYRKSGAGKLKLIEEKKRVVLSGTADLNNGHEVAKRTCFVCHKLHGEGTDVGPDLTGVGRSTLDALLHNVIDPNEVVGNGYETTEVETKDGTSYTGRVIEETDTRIKLVNAGPVEFVVAKSDVVKVTKKELSLMPEGLEQLPDNEFRDLMMYLLNPPQDNRPWTPALRKELFGIEEQKAAAR